MRKCSNRKRCEGAFPKGYGASIRTFIGGKSNQSVGIQDLVVTPIYLMIFGIAAYLIRPMVTSPVTKKYFLPALAVKFAGAIFLGLVYQFYYGGGDTFNYFTHGSRYIWEAFQTDPVTGLSILLESGGSRVTETYEYTQHIWYYRDPNSFFVVRIAAFIDILTFHTYSATSLFFALFSFSGMWMFFTSIVRKYPGTSARWLAIAILFVPSTIFWGSGILKDTITYGALGWMTWALLHIIEFRQKHLKYWIAILAGAWLLFSIKVYILICFAPLVLVWIYWKHILSIRNLVIRLIIAPVLMAFFLTVGYLAVNKITEDNARYSLDNVAQRAAITAYDIRYGWGARTGGEGGYDIGLPDGTISGTLKLMPAAINVSLFRPYLWEVKNPLMLLASLESTIMLILSFWYLIVKRGVGRIFSDPFLIFCLIFSLLFAFAVGVSTFNFGTLMRYKIPMMPFFLIVLVISQYSKTKQ